VSGFIGNLESRNHFFTDSEVLVVAFTVSLAIYYMPMTIRINCSCINCTV
jgi:hypothetical protein